MSVNLNCKLCLGLCASWEGHDADCPKHPRFDEVSVQELMEADDDNAALQAYAAHAWRA